MMNILAVIPARAGSKGIPKKNVRMLVGKPLVAYAIENAIKSKYITHVAVSTDDVEVKQIALKYNIKVVERPAFLCEDCVTLDSVIYHATEEVKKTESIVFDYVITLQPTSPLLTAEVLDKAVCEHIESNADTTISAVNTPHLAWSMNDNGYYPLYKKRVNRQYLPKHLSETGAFVITAGKYVAENSRFGNKINIYETPAEQSVDIDTWQDWVLAEATLKRKNILFRVDGYNEIGTGHIYRALLLAYNMTEHNVIFCLNKKSDIGIEKIQNSYFKYFVIENNNEIIDIIKKENIDIVVNDILDTEEDYIKLLKNNNVRIVNFEDVGSGSIYADEVVNALYEKQFENKRFHWGKDYYCLRSEFMLASSKDFSDKVKNIVVLFGGTDPCNLTDKVYNAIHRLDLKDIRVTFILGLGYKNYEQFLKKCSDSKLDVEVVKNVSNISEYMREADIAISSQGRTMFELAAINVPTIIIAQNEREQSHGFGDLSNGFMNLGIGKNVDEDTIAGTLKWLIDTPYVRKSMYEKMCNMDLSKGIERVKKIILG